ncbi:hypothetical protein BGZ59_005666 [Podila verticillata]|nr:hypothetical protein BGZ59_005666 [Podila verticillata]
MNKTALQALPAEMVAKLCRSKPTRLSLKQMYSMGRHVLDARNPSALVIPAVFLHQELPIRLSHALKLLGTNILPQVNISELPTFQRIARSYLEDISLVTQIPKPSTPKLESEFTTLLRDLDHRHKIKMLAVHQGVQELMQSVSMIEHNNETQATDAEKDDEPKVANQLDPAADQAIRTFFDTFYTLNIGTRLLIGEHLALHDRGVNLVQRLNPVEVSKRAIRNTCHQLSFLSPKCQATLTPPPVHLQATNPGLTTTFVDDFLHQNLVHLLTNAMQATLETHVQNGSPVSLNLASLSSSASTGSSANHSKRNYITTTTARAKLPPVQLFVVDGEEDVTIKVSDHGCGLALAELDRVWGYLGTHNHHLPKARQMARYFGGDLSLISMQGHGTDAYLSLHRNDNLLENWPTSLANYQASAIEATADVDSFVNELLDLEESSFLYQRSNVLPGRSLREKAQERQELDEPPSSTPRDNLVSHQAVSSLNMSSLSTPPSFTPL